MISQLVLTSVALLCLVSAQRGRCGEKCRFRFCKADGRATIFDQPGPRLLLRDARIASHPFVCWRRGTGRIKVRTTGKPLVYSAEDLGTKPEPFVAAGSFRKNPRLPGRYFGLREINQFPPIPGEKGIFRSKAGNRLEAASDNLCVKIPIEKYVVSKKVGKRIKNRVIRAKDEDDCISFRTTVPEILIEATWNSSDDLDLSVVEPKNSKISFRRPKSPSGGRLILDQNTKRCFERDPDGREQITWLLDDNPRKGRYTVQLKHFRNCKNGPTNWHVAVIIRGKLAKLKTGSSDEMKSGTLIEEFSFRYP